MKYDGTKQHQVRSDMNSSSFDDLPRITPGMDVPKTDLKNEVWRFWNEKSCGEVYAHGQGAREQFEAQARERYLLEPYIHEFAAFKEGRGKNILEIGVGMGADHLEWARAHPRSLSGIDLTDRAVSFTRDRLALYGFHSDVRVGDAENLTFADNTFDIVYSYGVLHHTPNTAWAILEVLRVLRPGGVAKIMIYHRNSVVGLMLWTRYGLLAGRPFRDLSDIYARHLESPGTKAFTVEEARAMFERFSRSQVEVRLAMGDLLEGAVGQKHSPRLLRTAKALWPRWFIRSALKNYGLEMFITAVK